MRRAPFPAALAAGLLAGAGCAPAPRPAPPVVVGRPAPAPVPAATPAAADWRDRPATPGTWRYRQDERGSLALFGAAGADALLTLRCDRGARAVYLARAGGVAAPLVLRTTSLERTLAVQVTGAAPAGQAAGAAPVGGAPPPYAVATLAPTDPLLDAMGFSRGRFAVEQAGSPPLGVPAWPELERVTEDCRG